MKQLDHLTLRLQQGFSLVEIMVGMAVGMIGIIIIMQVTSVFDARKGTTSGGDEAQNNGVIALFAVQKNIAQAGYGISSAWLIGKPLTTPNIAIAAFAPVMVNPAQLAPVRDPGSDAVLLFYGNSNIPEGDELKNTDKVLPYRVQHGTTAGNNLGEGGVGFRVGDWVIPTQSGVTPTHSLYQVLNPAAPGTVVLNGAPPLLANDPTGTSETAMLLNLGPSPSLLAYAVINQSLSVCDYMLFDCAASTTAPAWEQLAGNIVGLKAVCESSTGLRVVLVSRSTRRDAGIVTNATPVWNPAAAPTAVVADPVLSWGADWDHYRYKTFETVIPIRNAIWSQAGAAGC